MTKRIFYTEQEVLDLVTADDNEHLLENFDLFSDDDLGLSDNEDDNM